MKKLFAALGLLTAINAFAVNEDWQLVTDSSNGDRLVVDANSVQFEKYNRSGTQRNKVGAIMQYLYKEGNASDPFYVAIDADDCIEKNMGPIVNVYKDRTSKSYTWFANGPKMYDAQGQWLCGYTKGAVEAFLKKKKEQEESGGGPAPQQDTKPKTSTF